jgi:hypothetical protein
MWLGPQPSAKRKHSCQLAKYPDYTHNLPSTKGPYFQPKSRADIGTADIP